MHTTRKKRNKSKPDRYEYLHLLIVEFQEVKSKDARRQVLANLANFAYDPYNYKFFRQLEVLDLFLSHLLDADETLIHFSISGLCNLSLDPENKEYILKNNGVCLIQKLLESRNENILISAITTLMFLITPESKREITDINNIKCILKLARGKNRRIKNLAQIFLDDFCSEQEVKAALDILESSVQDIPLPDS
ncbi:UNVERIFIED_CONTAM: hypothetical protein PYX00_002447 [Menopon gallinae]|uniref:Armadillo repeat-containing protein 7 n=1 Tax=Menopon gallinae TaxID=328185 RepID=A0AAW2IGV3_9NEOP